MHEDNCTQAILTGLFVFHYYNIIQLPIVFAIIQILMFVRARYFGVCLFSTDNNVVPRSFRKRLAKKTFTGRIVIVQ